VSLTMNDTIDFTGLATYVLGETTGGVTLLEKTLAIGATAKDANNTYTLNGIANVKK
jgi:hypothetical protein